MPKLPRLKIDRPLPDKGDVGDDSDEHVKPFVSESLDAKTLYFSISAIQSRMQLRHPHALALDYTRTMMGFVLFRPAPQRIAMIGLGGGSMAKWCHRHLPHASLVVVEVNPHVIALRDTFQVPPDSARFQVVQADGARFVADTDERFDVLLVDAFDIDGTPPALCTARFYGDCMDVLAPGGLLVINLHTGHRDFELWVDRLRQACAGHLLQVNEPDGCNAVVFASPGGALPHQGRGELRRPAGLAADAWAELGPVLSRIRHAAQQGDTAQ